MFNARTPVLERTGVLADWNNAVVDNPIIPDLSALEYLELHGAKFCRVAAWNAKCDHPGKEPIERGWQNNQLALANVLDHVRRGGNVGQLTGHGNLVILDVDRIAAEFMRRFDFASQTAAVERDGADKIKLELEIVGDVPPPQKWYAPGEKHPYLELLAYGNQGVVYGTHPEGAPYRLVRGECGIWRLTPEILSEVCYKWSKYVTGTGTGLKIYPADVGKWRSTKKTSKNAPGDGLLERVKDAWPVVKVFEHHGFASDPAVDGDGQLRLRGNGGLLITASGETWAVPGAGRGVGGGPFQAWKYCTTGGTSSDPGTGREFYNQMIDMAAAANIPVPQHEHTQAPVLAPVALELDEDDFSLEDLPPQPDLPYEWPSDWPRPAPPEPERAPENAARPRIVERTLADALQPQPPVEWCVDGMFETGTVNVLFGDGGTLKTWSLLDLAVCVAMGKPWINEFATKQGPALIVDEESGDRRLARRLGMVARGHFAPPETPVITVSLARFDLRDPVDVLLLEDLIIKHGAVFAVVDALMDVMPGADENSVGETSPMFQRLREVATRTGATIFVIHHANKSGGYRGSTAIKGMVDNLVLAERKRGSTIVDFTSEKDRDAPEGKFSAEVRFSEDQVYLVAAANQAERTDPNQPRNKSERYVMRYLTEHGAADLADIIAAPDTCTTSGARQAVYSLADRGIIRRCDGGGRGSAARYEISPAGEVASDSSV